MSKIQFFLGKSKGANFEVKRPTIVEGSKVQSNYTENDPQAPSYILNRPFYSETVTEPLEITWDGVWGGRPYNVVLREGIEGLVMVKVTDMVFTVEQLRGAYVTMQGAESETVPVSDFEIKDDSIGTLGVYNISAAGLPLVTVITEDGAIDGISFEKGTYFLLISGRENNEFIREFVSSLSFPSVTYTKYYKLDNNFVDAEWMATESTGEGTKKFELKSIYDAALLGAIDENSIAFRLDSRFYTKEELLGARLILSVTDAYQFSFVAAYEDNTFSGVVAYRMIGLEEGTEIVLLSVEEDSEVTLEKGLYLAIDGFGADEEISGTLEIYNVTGQSFPNKLPNKFLDLDWVPKSETYLKDIYSGSLSGNGEIQLPYDSQLTDLDTVLLFTVNGVTREVRGAGASWFVDIAGYIYFLSSENYISVYANGDNAALQYTLSEDAEVTIRMVKKVPNPIPKEFLPVGILGPVVIEIDHALAEGLSGYETEIEEAWNNGARVTLQFTDFSMTLLSFRFVMLDGVYATAVTTEGRVYLFDPLDRGNGWALNIKDVGNNPASVLYKEEGSTEFVPTALNATLTEGSTLPAQEGAVFTAIQTLKNTIGTLNQDLENRLNGGT